MQKKILAPLAAAIVLGIGNFAVPTQAEASSPFKWMNPFEWFDNDDHDDWYYRRHHYNYGYGGPWGWGGYPGAYRPPIIIQTGKSNKVAAAAPKLPE
jgi:hypothetical protein